MHDGALDGSEFHFTPLSSEVRLQFHERPDSQTGDEAQVPAVDDDLRAAEIKMPLKRLLELPCRSRIEIASQDDCEDVAVDDAGFKCGTFVHNSLCFRQTAVQV